MPSCLLWIASFIVLLLTALSCYFPIAAAVQLDTPLSSQLSERLWWTPTPVEFFAQEAEASPTPGAATPTPEVAPVVQPLDTPEAPATAPAAQEVSAEMPPHLYYTQAGDTLPAVAVRFGVAPSEIVAPDPVPETGFINPNQLLLVPFTPGNTTSGQRLMADSEVVNSPSTVDFDVHAFVEEAGGYLSEYDQYLGTTGVTTGAEVIERISSENSINPRLLLALLEHRSGWVYGEPPGPVERDYPMGHIDRRDRGLYKQLAWAVNQLSIGYYGWREGLLTDIRFPDGTVARLHPELNSGTVALQHFFAQIYGPEGWLRALDQENGFPALHTRMFGNAWARALLVEPLFPPDLTQPPLILPFLVGQLWSFSGGPHGAWERDGSQAALDFAPGSVEPGCVDSNNRVTAAAAGLIVRSGHGVVVIDLDGDGLEQTGWTLMYLHVSDHGLRPEAPAGTWVDQGQVIGYPSCEGGFATGTHIHIARKYNGEWMAADGPIPFNLDGWVAHAGEAPYKGSLTRGDQVVIANQLGTFETRIMRDPEFP